MKGWLVAVGSYQSDRSISVHGRSDTGWERVGAGGPGRASFLHAAPFGLFATVEKPAGELALIELGQRDGGRVDIRTADAVDLGQSLPCHLAVLPGGEILVTNYGSGSLSLVAARDRRGNLDDRVSTLVLPARQPAGRGRQASPHAHQALATPWGTMLISDLGSDRVVEVVVQDGALRVVRAIDLPRGAGPRHMEWVGGLVAVVGELDSTIHLVRISPDTAEMIDHIPTHGGPAGAEPSHVQLDSSGRWMFVLNRGPDTIAVFEVREGTVAPASEQPSGGVWPRHFVELEGTLLVANQRSDDVTEFTFDRGTGDLVPTTSFATPSPTCVVPVNPARTSGEPSEPTRGDHPATTEATPS